MKRLARLCAYAALGPISGPLMAGIVRNLGRGEPVLASLYSVALGASWFDMALLSGWAGRTLIHLGR